MFFFLFYNFNVFQQLLLLRFQIINIILTSNEKVTPNNNVCHNKQRMRI